MTQWFVVYNESSDDQGRGPCSLSIGPHENDSADTFAFSENFNAADGIPEDVEKKFQLLAAAPGLLTACKAIVAACDAAPPIHLLREITAAAELARNAITEAET